MTALPPRWSKAAAAAATTTTGRQAACVSSSSSSSFSLAFAVCCFAVVTRCIALNKSKQVVASSVPSFVFVFLVLALRFFFSPFPQHFFFLLNDSCVLCLFDCVWTVVVAAAAVAVVFLPARLAGCCRCCASTIHSMHTPIALAHSQPLKV